MRKLRTFINYRTTGRPWGGSNSFLCALKEYLKDSENIEIVSDKSGDLDLLLLNTAYIAPGKYVSLKQIRGYYEYGYSSFLQYVLKGLKKRQIQIVLRLDGLRRFYADMPEVKGDRIQLKLIKLAHAIIFQSDESLKQFQRVIGDVSTPYYIIHNGVSHRLFNMDGKKLWNKRDKLKIFATSWSTNPRKGFEVIAKLSRIDGVVVNFVGNWPKEIDPEKTQVKLPMPQNLLAEEYKKNDLFFFPSQNEACANVVYEALSCGLPVIYHPSGGTSEIASEYGVELTDNIYSSVERISDNYDFYIEQIKHDHRMFSIDYAGAKYVEVFQKVYLG
ncbi:MAG: glycosyltransferase [Candidatus Scalindua sp.]